MTICNFGCCFIDLADTGTVVPQAPHGDDLGRSEGCCGERLFWSVFGLESNDATELVMDETVGFGVAAEPFIAESGNDNRCFCDCCSCCCCGRGQTKGELC